MAAGHSWTEICEWSAEQARAWQAAHDREHRRRLLGTANAMRAAQADASGWRRFVSDITREL